MLKKFSYRVLLFTILLSIPLMLGTTSVVLAGGGNVEDPVRELGGHLEGPVIVGDFSATLIEDCSDPDCQMGGIPPKLSVAYTVVGQCQGKDIDMIVGEMTGDYVGIATVNDFLNATDRTIETIILLGKGPAGCHSDAGGEDIIGVNVIKPVHSVDFEGRHTISAGVVALTVVIP